MHWISAPLAICASAAAVWYFLLQTPVLLVLCALSFLLFIVLAVFFRDPKRDIGGGIVSPADGVVDCVAEDGGVLKVGVFMNLHNVHVNRSPIDGTIIKMEHTPGGYAPAYKREAHRNEKLATTIQSDIGDVRVEQITGALVRRIVPYVKTGDSVRRGQKIGIVRFGSRVDTYLPANRVKAKVSIGQKLNAGQTMAERE